jgi:hypothetical protein
MGKNYEIMTKSFVVKMDSIVNFDFNRLFLTYFIKNSKIFVNIFQNFDISI